jgi:hypothetical protein
VQRLETLDGLLGQKAGSRGVHAGHSHTRGSSDSARIAGVSNDTGVESVEPDREQGRREAIGEMRGKSNFTLKA